MTAMLQTDDERYEAIARRDPAAEGFYVAVRTTKIYCRPTCFARTPLRKNVSFFERREDAIGAGYRACKRCRPELDLLAEPLAAEIDDACRTLDVAEQPPSLDALASRANVSPFHFQRAFKKRVGVSPKQYAVAVRERRLQLALGKAPTVTDAALDAGFGSPSALYETRGVAAGMRPLTYRAGGRGERVSYATTQTSVGRLLVARTERGICALDLDENDTRLIERLRQRFHAATLAPDDRALATDVGAAVALVEGRSTAPDLPLDIRGTAFQHRVWNALRAIPAGETRTYAEVAQAIGQPAAARAVASACAGNTLAIAIPCHRVVRGDGGLGGYRWGVERKRTILRRESSAREA